MLRRTHVYKSHDLVSLLASFNSTPVDVLDRSGYSIVADWTGGSTATKTFVSGKAEVTDVTAVADVGAKEVTTVACLADNGAFELGVITFPAVAALAQGDYAVISNVAGDKWAVWFDIDAAGIVPTGAAYTAITPANRVMASVATGDLAPAVAAAAVAALGTLTNITVLDNTDGTVNFTQTKVGNPTNITPHNTDDSGAGSLTVATTPGVNSNLNNTYFTISSVNATSKAQKDFFVWFNVNSEGTAPVIAGKTAVAVALAAGAADTAVATAVKNALHALTGDFTAAAPAATVTVTNVKVGNVTNAADGVPNTGFTINTSVTGANSNLNNKYFTIQSALDAVSYYVWFNVNGLGTDPAVAGKTGVEVAVVYGTQADTDVAAAIDAATIAGISSAAVGATVTFTNAATGASTNAADGTAATGFTFSVTTQGVTTQIDQVNNQATVTSHGLITGAKIALTTTGGLPSGLASTMFAIVVDSSTLKFATTLARALAGTAEDITSDGTGTHTVTPVALSGSFKLQASNDYNPKINPVAAGTWSDITGSSVAVAGSGSFGWNVSDAYYAWVRLVWTFADGTGSMSASTCVKD
jgi:hypothetical protein